MSSVLSIWHAQYVSTGGALRQDSRARITWAIGLVVDIIAGFWTFNVLSGNLAQWQAEEQLALATHLWLLCLYMWAGISSFAVIAVVSQGFGNDQAILLMSMPLTPAARLRALYGLVVFTGVGNWIVLATVVTAISLVTKLRWQALPWLLMLDMGVAATVCMSLIATLLVMRFMLPHLKRTFTGLAIAGVSIGAVVLLLHASKYSLHVAFPVQLMPVLTSTFCVLLLLIILGPLARSAGTLYQHAFYTMEGRSARRAALMMPGMRMFRAWLSRYRTLTGALLYKGLLNQSRNVFTWGRAAILVICVALFPLLQKVMIAYDFSSLAQVTVYSSVVAIIAVVEYAAYAISSEGARMIYYLLAPFNVATYLRARLISFLLPVLFIGLAVCLILSWWVRLSFYDAGVAALLIVLLLVGYTAFIVWGSAFDLDINQVAEGAMQTLMLEELPVTPRRLQLLGLSILLLTGMVLLIVKLPTLLIIFALVLLDGVVCIGFGKLCLSRVSYIKV
jgi:hypothetical protein